MMTLKRFAVLSALLVQTAVCASSPKDSTLRFAFITDSHISVGNRSVEDLSACLRDINGYDSLSFVIFGGDITDFGSDSELALAKSMIDTLRKPYRVVPGNHDANWSESGCNTFLKVFGYEHFSFRAKGWRFIGCGSGPDMRMSPGLVPREAMNWLGSLENEGRTIFINHYPMDSSVLNYFDVTKELKRLGVKFEIGGHWHRNTVLNYDGIPGVLCRSSLSAGKEPGYTVVRLSPDEITFSERRIYGDTAVELAPWYSYRFTDDEPEPVDCDSDGLPESYPWMRYDVNRRYPGVSEVWKRTFEANIVAGFAVKGDRAFFPLASGVMKCISLRDGSEIWSRDFGAKIYSTPAVSGNTLVFGCSDGCVYALRIGDGSLKWKYRASKSILASPVIADGKVYIGGSDNAFRALDIRDGKAVWTYAGVEGHSISTPYLDRDRIVFGTWARKLYSLDPATGREQWVWTVDKYSRMYSPAHCVPVGSSGRIFVAVPDRKVYAIDAATGRQLFQVDGGRDAICLSEDGRTVFSKTLFGNAYAFRADVTAPADGGILDSGREIWNVRNSAGYDMSPSALTEVSGLLLIPSDKGNVIALDSSDGRFLWAHKISVGLVNPLRTFEKRGKLCILASTMDGTVTLMQLRDTVAATKE